MLDQAGSLIEESTDDEPTDNVSIEQEVADFRSFLDTLDPGNFGSTPEHGGPDQY